MSPEDWTRRLINTLIWITHQQWVYRNYKVHFWTMGSLTVKENDEIFDSLGDLMHTDPDDLLLQHQYLPLVDPWINLRRPAKQQASVDIEDGGGNISKGKVNVIGSGGRKQTELEEGKCVDGESRISQEH